MSAEKMYSINFTKHNKKFCLSLHCNGANSCLFVNGEEIHKFKAKDSEIVATPLCLGEISKDWTVDNMKKTGSDGYGYDFSVDAIAVDDYDAIAVDDILDIYNYLMKKRYEKMTWYNKMSGSLRLIFISAIMFFGCILPSVNSLKCISVNNQECKVRPQIVNANSKEPVFLPFSIKISKCRSSCNNINDPYAKLCLPNVVKIINVKVFNLMSRTNETRHIEWHGTCKCKCKCKLDRSVCNNK